MNPLITKSAIIAALVVTTIIPQGQAALVTAGELIVDVRNQDIDSSTNVWVNQSVSANTVGDFATQGGGDLQAIPALSDTNGVVANALYVDSVSANSVISALKTPVSLESNNTCSVEAWIYAEALNNVVLGWGSTHNNELRSFHYTGNSANGMFSAYGDQAGQSGDISWGGYSLPLNQWTYVVWTYDGVNTLKGYINGNPVSSGTIVPQLFTTHDKLGIGCDRGNGTSPFPGYIADVRVHTGVLGDSDIINNYAQGMTAPADLKPHLIGLDDQSVYEGVDATIKPQYVTGALPQTYQWSDNGSPISGETNSTLVASNVTVAANDGHVYTLIANNSYGSTTNSMTLTVLEVPTYNPATINLDVNHGSGVTYVGTAIANGGGAIWNIINTTTHDLSTVVDAYGNSLPGCTLTIARSGGYSSYSDGSSGSPNPSALMSDYLYNGSSGDPYVVTVSGLKEGDYTLYAYAHNNTAGPSTVTVAATNGSASASTTDAGEYRNIYQTNVVAEGNSYLAMTGSVAVAGGSFSFTVYPYMEGFQLQHAAPAIIGSIPDQVVFTGSTNTITPPSNIAGREPFTYTWKTGGVTVAVGPTLELTGVTTAQEGQVWELVVSNGQGSDTNSFALHVINGDYDTYPVNLQLDCNTSNEVNYAGTAISSDSGTNWISFLSPSSGTSVTLTNVVDSHGSATDYSITFVTSEGWDIYKDESLGNPNPLNLMSDYLFKGPYNITVSNLPPGEYNLYVYAHGDQSNQVATIAVDAGNGGDSGATTGYGEWRNIYQANAVSNSYLSLSATVPSSGILKFSSSDYLNGFQLHRVATGVGPISISAISVSGGMASISWTSDLGAGYSIESTPSLTSPSWSEVTNVTSVGSQTTPVPVGGGNQEFYRISK